MNRAIFQDAGLLRQYVAERYADVLIYGGPLEAWRRGYRLVKILSRMSGKSVDEVLRDLRTDYRLLNA